MWQICMVENWNLCEEAVKQFVYVFLWNVFWDLSFKSGNRCIKIKWKEKKSWSLNNSKESKHGKYN